LKLGRTVTSSIWNAKVWQSVEPQVLVLVQNSIESSIFNSTEYEVWISVKNSIKREVLNERKG